MKLITTLKFALAYFLIALFFGCNNSNKIEVSDKDWKQAKTAFQELKEALNKEDGKTWNHTLQGPIMLVNRDTRQIITNEKDDAGVLQKKEELFVGKLPENINIANTALNWNGKRWTMVAFPLPDTKQARLSLLIHESFHRIQPMIGFDSLSEIQNTHLDTKDGRIYLKLELEALKKALKSTEPNIHLKNALLFRQYRQQLFPEAKKAENSLEINEGLAEYTGSILSQRTDEELKKHYISQIDWFYHAPTFVRSFPYFTIPVYGYFIHLKDKNWNLQLSKNTNLSDFLYDYWNVKPQKIISKEEIIKTGENYGIDSISAQETQREMDKIVIKEKYKKVFLSDSILEINLENMRIGFNPSNIMPLDSLGTVYPNLRITDNWGILKVDSCGALVSPNWKSVTVSYPNSITDTLISGKGWKLKLNDKWELEKTGVKYKVSRKPTT